MKKILVFALTFVFVLCAPSIARTKYDKYGHKITPQKKTKVHAAAKIDKTTKNADLDANGSFAGMQYEKQQSRLKSNSKEEEKVKEKNVQDARGRSMGKVVRDGDSNNFTMYDQRGRKTGSYVEDENGNGKYYDIRGREISRSSRQTKDIK